MKTILLNGSPKGNIEKSGSYQLCRAFSSGFKNPCEILAIATEEYHNLFQKIADADRIVIIVPIYIHSIPSFVLDFLYHLPQNTIENRALGFILQSGFPESSESDIAARFLEQFIKKSGYQSLGIVIKGECAGLAIMPDKFGKLIMSFQEFGTHFERTGSFDEVLTKKFAEPVYLSKTQTRILNFMQPLSRYLGWDSMLKKNHAYEKRFDMPFLNE